VACRLCTITVESVLALNIPFNTTAFWPCLLPSSSGRCSLFPKWYLFHNSIIYSRNRCRWPLLRSNPMSSREAGVSPQSTLHLVMFFLTHVMQHASGCGFGPSLALNPSSTLNRVRATQSRGLGVTTVYTLMEPDGVVLFRVDPHQALQY
jgi:hypothetical protein